LRGFGRDSRKGRSQQSKSSGGQACSCRSQESSENKSGKSPEQGRQQDDLDARVNSCGAKERSLTQENFQKKFESY
jgi:hypothetical protein